MTAEGTACNGAGEAPKAELAAAKGAVAAAPPGERPAEERAGEGVGGPFVIVDGDSDGLSDRGSDLDRTPNEDSPSNKEKHPPSNASRGRRSRGRRPRRGSNMDRRPDEDSSSEEDDEPPSNAGPDAAAGRAHGAASGELGASDATLGVSLAEGHDRATAESEDGVDEGKREHSADLVAELVEQETAGGEQGGAEAPAASGIGHADTGADSAAPAVDSEVNGKESTREESAAADVAELLAHEAATEEHDGADAAAESSGRDDTITHAESGCTALESEVCGEESKGEHGAAEVMDLVELGTDGSGAPMLNGHHDADMGADSCVTATEPVSPADDGQEEQGAANVTELVEQDAACGEQDDGLRANGHDHLDRSVDSCTPASEFKAHAEESKGQQDELEGAPTTEAEVSEGMLDASSRDCGTYTCEKLIEEQVVANGHGYAEDNADASVELNPGVEEEEGEATLGVLQLEDKIDKDSEGNLCEGHTADAVFSYKEAKPPMKVGINEASPAVADLDVITENKSEEIVQGDKLVKDDVSVGILHSVKPESDPSIESSGDQKVQVDVAAGDENTMDSDVKADSMVEMNTAGSIQTQELRTAVEDRSIPLHVNSPCEVEEKEFNRPPCLEEVNLAQNDDSSVQTGKHERLEAPCVGLADKSDNGVAEAEPRKEVEMEVVDAVPSQAAAASTFHNEPRSIDLVDNDSMKHSSLDTELESHDHIQTEECNSREIPSTTVYQVISGASMEHGTAVADDAKLSSETGDESQEISSETAVDHGEPVALNEDEAVVVVDGAQPSSATGDESDVVGEAGDISQKDESGNLGADSKPHKGQSEICDTSTMCDELSSTAGDKGSSPINEPASSIEESCPSDVTLEPEVKAPCTDKETCPSDETGKDICFGNVNAHTKSSHEVETKCLEALEPSSVDTVVLEEHKNDDEHADEAKIAEDSNKSPVDLDKSNKGDTQVIRQQRIYLIKVPKFAGEDLWAKTQDAQVHLDRLTQERDAINFRKQKQKAVCDEYREKLEAARQEEREARAAHGDKKHDLNSVRSMIGKLDKANSIEEIDEMIARKEKIMEHETISLKEEKLFIKEINELKAQRKQLCSNMGSKAEIGEAFHQKDHIHKQHKTLKKDSDVLFNNLKSLEENTRKIQKSYDDERTLLRKLNEEFQAANEIRQKAYSDWVELRAEPVNKNKYFFMYKRDRSTAFEYLSMGDMDGLQLYCNNQVERVLGMWNKDDNFRSLYVEANKFSTLRRLGTHDGRRLGPEEDPPVIPSNFNRRPSNTSPLTVSSPDVPILTSEVAPEKPVPVAVPVEEDSFPVLPSLQISKRAKSKASGSSSQKETTTAPVSEGEDVKHIEKEKARLMEEELELARKAEELTRREEELMEERVAAEKERLRLEQKAKAKEAEERKKRKAEKAQERAEFKARKEAEMKEKRRLKKDKRNGATAADSASGSGEGNSTTIAATDTDSSTSENNKDAEVSQQTTRRRTSRPAAAVKQLNRVQPMPLPLRNRGRRKMRQYILLAVAVLSVIALIVASSYIHLPSLRSLHF